MKKKTTGLTLVLTGVLAAVGVGIGLYFINFALQRGNEKMLRHLLRPGSQNFGPNGQAAASAGF